jgi:hypothetical protein
MTEMHFGPSSAPASASPKFTSTTNNNPNTRSTDKRRSITNDPNRADDPTYILRRRGKSSTVSFETVEIVRALPEWNVA